MTENAPQRIPASHTRIYHRTTSQFPESDRDRKPRLAPRALPYTAGFSLLADLDSVSRGNAAAAAAGNAC